MLWLPSIAFAGVVRVTVEIGPDGPALQDAVPVSGRDTIAAADHGPAIEVLSATGALLAVAPVPDGIERSVILPDGGGAVARLERGVVRIDVPWPDGSDRLRLGGRTLVPRVAPPPAGESLVALQESGPAEERLDLVFLGDGYTETELTDFASDVDFVVDYLLSIDPYGAYTGLFNIWRIDVASNDSGASHLELGTSVDTALGCYYGCGGIDRLICCDDRAVTRTVGALLPGADGIMVLVNDPTYGGSGGFTYATAYADRTYGHQVAAHELGHSLVGLWDEYSYGYAGSGEGPNCAEDNEAWSEWVGTDGVDAYPTCSYTNLSRPTDAGCMMLSLQDGYCPVCRQEAVLAMYGRLPSLVVSTDPPEGELDGADVLVTATALGPDDGLAYEWALDGEVVGTEATLDLGCVDHAAELTLHVYDPTAWVRADPDALLEDEAGPWTITAATDCAPVDDTDRPGGGGGKDEEEAPVACGCKSVGARGSGWIAAWTFATLLTRRRGARA